MVCRQQEKGFLMIEVVIAIVIISIALVAAGGMFIQATRANTSASQYTAATALAQEQLERLKQQPSTYWKGLTVPRDISLESGGISSVTLNSVAYTITTNAKTCPEDATNLVQVEVTVSWNSNANSVMMTGFYPKISLPL